MTLRVPAERHRPRLSVPVPGAREAFVRGPVVGEEYGNARTARQRMSSPPSPRPHETDVLHAAAEPVRRHPRPPVEDDRTEPDLTPARHEVTPVEVSLIAHEPPPRSDEHRQLGREPR